jgi:hypothetical protein
LSFPSLQIFSLFLERDRVQLLKEVGHILYLVYKRNYSNHLQPVVHGQVKAKVMGGGGE